MSDSDEHMSAFIASESGSDFEAPVKAAKAKAAPKPKAKARKGSDASENAPLPKAKKAAAPKKAPAAKKAPAKAKTALGKRANNGSLEEDSNSDSDGSAVVKVVKGKKPAARKETEDEAEMSVDEDDDAPVKPKPKAASKNASTTYQKLTQLEHVLKRPDTYIGSIEATSSMMWVFERATSTMKFRNITYVPGLYKIFDEILVNAADNKQNDAAMNTFKVNIDSETGTISVYNNGKGIPVEIHEKEGIYIPELIFGHLLTSSNYDDEQRKVTGGRNGYGAKLANIYSTSFTVETADAKNQKKYKQTWSNNMSKRDAAKITDNKRKEEYTKITFTPDYARFGMEGIDKDTEALLCKRVYDMAGTCSASGVKVYLNDTNLSSKIKSFKHYVEMYATAAKEINADAGLVGASPTGASAGKPTIIYEKAGERWEIAFTPSDGQFSQVSFVNAIATTKGGTHVDHVAKQLVEKIVEVVNKKNKAVPVKPFQVKNHLWVFVNCMIENPAFDSQTKENMTLAQSKFGSRCKVSDDFIKKVHKSGVVESILNFAKFKQDQALKKTDRTKRSRLSGFSKLEDANKAGTKEGSKCTLILTEGDSAKALAVAGIGVIGRDYYGVFPLRGKLLNVREASGKSLTENAEIQAIKQIMGLQHQKVYQDTSTLRYGHLMIMTDQDHDGSHIKGLLINYFDFFYPSLLKCADFLVEFITPIVKVTKGKKDKSFFTIPEYETWKEENNDGRGWVSKYYKGLGTSTANDAKKYFSNMAQHRLAFKPAKDEDRSLIDMAFNKKKADDRKEWLRGFVPGTFLDHSVTQIPISDFVNKELILFSMADNVRSIPSAIDGLKPGQRKVLFACFKKKLKNEIKVAQLAGYIGEQTAYHHGEQSLLATIVGLAQNFVGSNNINLLDPNGQFGTRLAGGKDAASPRYIFTNVGAITRTLFHSADDGLLNYLTDDGHSIEPFWYIPILPMILVNGSDGIGTGWSSSIPNFNPSDIVENLKRKMRNEPVVAMEPWFRGFEGTITNVGKDKYTCTGVYDMPEESTLKITELPVRVWTQTYKDQLEKWTESAEDTSSMVRDLKEYHTENTVSFNVSLSLHGKKQIAEQGVEKAFKLTSSISTSNMVAFDVDGKIKKYANAEEILEDFYDLRLDYYHKRKEHLLYELNNVLDRLSNQARFILAVIERQLIINKRAKHDIAVQMRKEGYKPIPKLNKKADGIAMDENAEEEEEVPEAAGSVGEKDSDFDYCLNMTLSSLTKEKLERLLTEKGDYEEKIDALSKRSPKELWNEDLDAFMVQWEALLADDNTAIKANKAISGKGKAKSTKAAKKAVAYNSDDEEEDDDYETAVKKPAAKKTPPKPKKAAAKPVTPTLADLQLDSPPVVKPGTKKRVSPQVTKPGPAKKAKTTKNISDDDSDDSDVFVAAKPKAKVAVKKTAAPAKVAAAPAKSKKKPIDLSSDDASDVDDMSEDFAASSQPVAPRERVARGAAQKKTAYAEIDLDSSEGDSEKSASASDSE